MSEWKLILNKEIGIIDIETFPTKKKAEESLQYRNTLTKAMGYTPDLIYEIVEVKKGD
tara:strand:- start:3156 stop:3329 length:174 start_codon:yes stop_codon:yes gene_type:complete